MIEETARIQFTELLESDLNAIHELHSLPETDEYNTLGIPTDIEMTRQILLQWIDGQSATPRTDYTFCLRVKDTNEFIGLMGLKIGKAQYRVAEVWYKIHPLHWLKGYATEALSAILGFGFKQLALHRVEAGTAADNLASVRVLEKAGFTLEGRKRKLLPLKRGWSDNYFYAILETDSRI